MSRNRYKLLYGVLIALAALAALAAIVEYVARPAEGIDHNYQGMSASD